MALLNKRGVGKLAKIQINVNFTCDFAIKMQDYYFFSFNALLLLHCVYYYVINVLFKLLIILRV